MKNKYKDGGTTVQAFFDFFIMFVIVALLSSILYGRIEQYGDTKGYTIPAGPPQNEVEAPLIKARQLYHKGDNIILSYAPTPNDSNLTARQHYEASLRYYKTGKLKRALTEANLAKNAAPGNGFYAAHSANILTELHRPKEALKVYNHAISKGYKEPWVIARKAKSYYKMKMYALAEREFRKAIKGAGERADEEKQKGSIKSEKNYNRQQASFHYGLSWIYIDQNQNKEADAVLDRMIAGYEKIGETVPYWQLTNPCVHWLYKKKPRRPEAAIKYLSYILKTDFREKTEFVIEWLSNAYIYANRFHEFSVHTRTWLTKSKVSEKSKTGLVNKYTSYIVTALQTFLVSGKWIKAEKIVDLIYAFHNTNISYFNTAGIEPYQVHSSVARGYGKACGNDTKQIGPCITSMQKILSSHDENYHLRNLLGGCFDRAGKKMEAHKARQRAYEDYLGVVRPAIPRIILHSPLKGKVLPIKYTAPLPGSHGGLWINAIDYLVISTSGKNISYNQPVYAPADGVITYVSDGPPDLSNLWLKLDNGLTVGMVHFKPGAFTVYKNQRVRAGQKLGVLGIPRNAHLHMHIFNRYGATIPYLFARFRSKDGKAIENAAPEKGKIYNYP